jgi:hypothetical protein
MLGFILSKMQMLIFATGIFIVAIMFFNFISGMQLKNITSSSLDVQIQTLKGQLSTESLCSFESIVIPEYFNHGLGSNAKFFYDLRFSKVSFGENITKLILSINEHNKKGVLDARSIQIQGDVILVDPGFIAEGEPVTAYYDKSEIFLYPRESGSGNQYAPPNAFVALKEVINGKTTLFVIPCTTLAKSFSNDENSIYFINNCEENILRVGCHKLYLEKNNNPRDKDKIGQCFEIDRDIIQSETSTTKISELTWADCKKHGYHDGRS